MDTSLVKRGDNTPSTTSLQTKLAIGWLIAAAVVFVVFPIIAGFMTFAKLAVVVTGIAGLVAKVFRR